MTDRNQEQKTISVFIPALNEEDNIQGSLDAVVTAAEKCFDDYEVIVINDGSTDRTPEIVEENIKKNDKIKLYSHSTPRNIGNCFKTALKHAQMEYCTLVSGDDPCPPDTLINFFSHAGEADFVCGYWEDQGVREKHRQIISAFYTGLLNLILGYNLKYYNGLQLHPTAWARTIDIESAGFGFYAETIVRALAENKSYVEVPIKYQERPEGGATKVFKMKNVISVIKTILLLYRIKRDGSKHA
ncbi:MAG: glycosyltransferase [candidate division Zixibacteria bacterium]|nr:glycosyltransferase [candidate division Zixibacteria bacterium]